jgi:hypothetical protein
MFSTISQREIGLSFIEKEEAKKSARAHQKANDFWMQTSSN